MMKKVIFCLICLILLVDFASCHPPGKFSFLSDPRTPSSTRFPEDPRLFHESLGRAVSHHPQNSKDVDRGSSLLASTPWLFHSLGQDPFISDIFIARRPDSELLLSGNGFKLGSRGMNVLGLTFFESNDPYPGQLVPRKRYGDAVTNYVLGSQPSEWRVGLSLWEQVLAVDVYPLIDVLYYTDPAGQLEFDFQLKAGANPNLIRFGFSGHSLLEIDSDGNAVISLSDGSSFILARPSIYQEVNDTRVEITGGFELSAENVISFWLGEYYPSLSIVIDPVLAFSTSFGGASPSIERCSSIAIDSENNLGILGYTNSPQFPTRNAYDATFNGNVDVFVAKFSPEGLLLFSTFLGGSSDDFGYQLAFDSSNNLLITGYTYSNNFPTTFGAYSQTLKGWTDAFIVKFNPEGSLILSTYFGGSSHDIGYGVAVDSLDNIAIVGYTASFDFPVHDAYSTSLHGWADAFVIRLDSGGSLQFATYLGGSGAEFGESIVIDSLDNIAITGETFSEDFPVSNAYSSNLGGEEDIFIAKFNPAGSLLFSTFFGGSGQDWAMGIAVDSLDNIALTGYTSSSDFPTLGSHAQSSLQGLVDAFVVKFDPIGSLIFSTYFGGSQGDYGYAIAIDSADNIALTGDTGSFDLFTLNAFSSTHSGAYDVFIAMLSSTGELLFSTYFGGSMYETGYGIAIDRSDNIAITGETQSLDLPVLHAEFSSYSGGTDGFVAKLTPTGSLIWSSFLGGRAESNSGQSVAIDDSQNIVLLGTTSNNLVSIKNANDPSFNGGSDVFLAKFSPTGELIFATYYGGFDNDVGNDVAIDSSGKYVIVGSTYSSDLPMLDAYDPSYHGGVDTYLAKFTSEGALVFSSYLGGSSYDAGNAIAIDSLDNVVITGYTSSTDFPLLNWYSSILGDLDIFITKFNSAGALLFSTLFGGSSSDLAQGIAVDSLDHILITGHTLSTDFPTFGAYSQNIKQARSDVIVAKFESTGTLIFSTFFGGNWDEYAMDIAIDSSDNFAITGDTESSTFPILNAYPWNVTRYGWTDVFIAKFSSEGALLFSTRFGGAAREHGNSIEVDRRDNIVITGWIFSDISTFNADFPVRTGSTDAFVLKLDPNGFPIFFTYFGGSKYDEGNGIATDSFDNIVITGMTDSDDFPLIHAFDSTSRGSRAFLAKFTFCAAFNSCSQHGMCSADEICICDEGWEADVNCSQFECHSLNNCSHHGTCVAPDTCTCDPGWEAHPDCSVPDSPCPNGCSGNGWCADSGSCNCYPKWSGADCSIPDCCELHYCSGHGACVDPWNCNCNEGWDVQPDCSVPDCFCLNDCSGHGACTAPDSCTCDEGWGVEPDCSIPDCFCLNDCSGHGWCAGPDNCQCDPKWLGPDCGVPDCCELHDCSGHGACVDPWHCNCEAGWRVQPDCSVPECAALHDCHGRGICVDHDVCQCDAGWDVVPDCSVPDCFCLNDCSGHGWCAGPGDCECDPKWEVEPDCSVPDCSELHDCSGHGRCVDPWNCACDEGWRLQTDCSIPDCE